MKRITSGTAAATVLAVSLLCGATPSSAAPPSHNHRGAAVAPGGHARSGAWHHHRLGGAFAGPVLPDGGAEVPGSWHINQNGLPYQVPYPCAYPLGADDAGVERFQTFGCPLP